MSPRARPEVPSSDAATDHRIVLGATAGAVVAVTVYTSVQSLLLHSWVAGSGGAALAVAAVVAPIVMLAALHLLRPERHGHLARCLLIGALALAAALTFGGARTLLALVVQDSGVTMAPGEFTSAALAAACAVALGLVQVDVARRIRLAERAQSVAQARATALVAELQEEELRLRYELAETIHGSVQGTFVVIETRLLHVATTLRDDDPAAATELVAVAGQLERLRERELRALSARLYPVDLERGLAPAVRALVVRLPPSVAVAAPDDEAFAAVESRLSHEARVLVVRVIEDALSNALRHGGADEIAIEALEDAECFRVTVVNSGTPPPPDAPWSGLGRLLRRAQVLGGDLSLDPASTPLSRTGARLTLTLPLPAPAQTAAGVATGSPRTPPPAP